MSGDKADSLIETVRASGLLDCPRCRAVYLARFFETLAQVFYPDSSRRRRAVIFFETSASWPDKTRISTPQLRLHLEAMFSAQERQKSRLYKRAVSEPAQGEAVSAEDPFFYQWEEEAQAEELTALGMTRWVSLLGAFCDLAAAHPERAHETASAQNRKQPHYQSGEGVLYLVFPAPFLQALAADCLLNLAVRKDFPGLKSRAEDEVRKNFEIQTPESFGHPA
ncbi:MAG: hypothetical protein FGM27_05695 [Candidatus Omnitrophica bacterium]|nr:hypothetical protein [Candidatus Omnitrophota bacterium]